MNKHLRKIELRYFIGILLGGVFLLLIFGVLWTLKKYKEGTI